MLLWRALVLVFGLSVVPGMALADDLDQALARAYEVAGAPAMAVVTATASGLDALHVQGRTSTANATPVGLDARWHLGSNAKAMVATLTLVLAREGVLALDEPIAAFFPGLGCMPIGRGCRFQRF